MSNPTPQPDPRTWTIAYRKHTANRFVRVTNWSGTWQQAYNLASAFGEAHPNLQVYYVPTAEHEQWERDEIAAGRLSADRVEEDHGNVLVDSGKRVRIVDTGQLDESLSAVTYCGACCNGDKGDSLTGRIPCTECDGNGRIAAPTPQPMQLTGQAAEAAAALRTLLDFIEANPELGARFARSFTNVMVHAGRENPRQVMADFARAGLAAGAKVIKDFEGDEWAQVFLHFGPIKIEVYGQRAEVCERVVVGTAEIEEEVPDPEALAAVPKVKVTKTVERVEWRCTPLLGDTRREVAA